MIGLTLTSFLAAMLSGDQKPPTDRKKPCSTTAVPTSKITAADLGRVHQEHHLYPLAKNYAMIIKEMDAESADEYDALLSMDAVKERIFLDGMREAEAKNYSGVFTYIWVVNAPDGESMLVTQAADSALFGGLSESHCIANRMVEEQSQAWTGSDECWPRDPKWGDIRSSEEGEPEVIDVSTGACVLMKEQLLPALTRVANEYVMGQFMCALLANAKVVHV